MVDVPTGLVSQLPKPVNLQDIEVIDLEMPVKTRQESCSHDVEFFFSDPYFVNGKKYRNCELCS